MIQNMILDLKNRGKNKREYIEKSGTKTLK
jgi:hypothetical protein